MRFATALYRQLPLRYSRDLNEVRKLQSTLAPHFTLSTQCFPNSLTRSQRNFLARDTRHPPPWLCISSRTLDTSQNSS